MLGIGTDLVFNKSGNENTSVKLEDNQQYRCNYSDRLHIFSSEEELSNFGSGISIEVNLSTLMTDCFWIVNVWIYVITNVFLINKYIVYKIKSEYALSYLSFIYALLISELDIAY